METTGKKICRCVECLDIINHVNDARGLLNLVSTMLNHHDPEEFRYLEINAITTVLKKVHEELENASNIYYETH